MATVEHPSPTIITFYSYQKKWLKDDTRFKIGMFSRQSGKTFTTCGEIVDDCIQAEIEGGRTRWVILSRGERQAKEAMEEAIIPITKAYYVIYQAQLKIKEPPEIVEYDYRVEKEDGKTATYKALEVTFPNGSRITALPANPDTARGFSANVLLDEFAFHADSRAIWKALFPVISKSGLKLRVVSTPNGKGNMFYDLVTGGLGWKERGLEEPAPDEDGWSRHIVDIYQAVSEGLDRDIDGLRTALRDEDAWAQEFELKWLDELGSWLTYEQISAVEHPDAGKPELYSGGPVYFGNDIARRKDLWVLFVWEQVGDVLWCREIIERKNIPFAEQDRLMDEAEQRYNPVRTGMDQTGMGEKPVEDAQIRYGEDRVEGVHLNGATRINIATVAKHKFEDLKVRIPAGNQPLRDDLHALKKIASVTGGFRLQADRDGNGHADRTWAAFIGIAMADDGFVDIEFVSSGQKRLGGKTENAGAFEINDDVIDVDDYADSGLYEMSDF